jgi:hypothetical protein
MRSIEVPDKVVGVFREDGDGEIRAALGVFAAKIVLTVFKYVLSRRILFQPRVRA